jgi:hypothetical protein
MRGTQGLTPPHGDGAGLGVVERRLALATTPADRTSTGGVADHTSALAVTSVESVDGATTCGEAQVVSATGRRGAMKLGAAAWRS